MLTVVAIMIVVLSISLLIITANLKVISAQDTTSSSNKTTTSTSATKVQAGGGNATDPSSAFVPQNIQIKAGESVTWDNPSLVAEPHTVTFVLDNKAATGIVSPFGVPNSTQFAAIPPNSNNEPLKVPGKDNVVIAVNARSFIPTVINSEGNVKHFAPPNVDYTMDGTEKYVNSGWLLPKGQEHVYPGSGNTFTVTFQKAGSYSYFCVIHPWMTGSVVVK